MEQETDNAAEKIAGLKVERLPLTQLNQHPRNEEIRNHPEEGSPRWRVLVKSLEHDYFDPIVWNERNGFLVSGHLRHKVMLAEGYTHADVSVVDYDEPTHMARMLAANKGIGEEDSVGISGFIKELDTAGLDLDLTGFDGLELDGLKDLEPTDSAGEEEREDVDLDADALDFESFGDAVDEIQTPTIQAHFGQYWKLGRHHLFVERGSKPPYDWASLLCELGDRARFILCPDIVVPLTDKDIELVMVSPSPIAASYILTTYAEVKGEEGIVLQEPTLGEE